MLTGVRGVRCRAPPGRIGPAAVLLGCLPRPGLSRPADQRAHHRRRRADRRSGEPGRHRGAGAVVVPGVRAAGPARRATTPGRPLLLRHLPHPRLAAPPPSPRTTGGAPPGGRDVDPSPEGRPQRPVTARHHGHGRRCGQASRTVGKPRRRGLLTGLAGRHPTTIGTTTVMPPSPTSIGVAAVG